MRDNAKRGRKRVQRSSSSSSRESSVDSPRVKKRKWSKRSGESKVRKKVPKKKPRRKASISSSSSDSRSCSTGRHGSTSGSGESEFKRVRGRSREKKKDKRNSGNARGETNKSKTRSRSCSSFSRYSNSSNDQTTEKVASEINSRRLRSVITVTKPYHEKEETEQDKDEHKEEIFYDQDDYPSCRSNDSNDGGKRDLAHHSYTASEKRRSVENLIGMEDSVSKLTSKESDSRDGGRSDQYDEINHHFDVAGIKNPDKENEIDDSATVAGSGSDNLESILRQKALENLMRFRGGPKTNVEPLPHHENKIQSNVKLSITKDDFVQNKSHEPEFSSGVDETQSMDQNNRPTLRKESSRPMQTEEKNLGGRDSAIESRAAKQTVFRPSNGAAISGNSKDKDYTTANVVNNKSESNTSALRQKSPGTGSSLKQVPPSHVSLQKTSLVTKNIIDKSAAETSQTVAGSSSNNQSVGVIDSCAAAPEPSCVKPTSEEHSSRECQDGSKANSQFEQKTMSVMRGGEMVQVTIFY